MEKAKNNWLVRIMNWQPYKHTNIQTTNSNDKIKENQISSLVNINSNQMEKKERPIWWKTNDKFRFVYFFS